MYFIEDSREDFEISGYLKTCDREWLLDWIRCYTQEARLMMTPKVYETGWYTKAYEDTCEIENIMDMYPYSELKTRYDTRCKTITKIEKKRWRNERR